MSDPSHRDVGESVSIQSNSELRQVLKGSAISGSSLIATAIDVRSLLKAGHPIFINGVEYLTHPVKGPSSWPVRCVELSCDYRGSTDLEAQITFTPVVSRPIIVSPKKNKIKQSDFDISVEKSTISKGNKEITSHGLQKKTTILKVSMEQNQGNERMNSNDENKVANEKLGINLGNVDSTASVKADKISKINTARSKQPKRSNGRSDEQIDAHEKSLKNKLAPARASDINNTPPDADASEEIKQSNVEIISTMERKKASTRKRKEVTEEKDAVKDISSVSTEKAIELEERRKQAQERVLKKIQEDKEKADLREVERLERFYQAQERSENRVRQLQAKTQKRIAQYKESLQLAAAAEESKLEEERVKRFEAQQRALSENTRQRMADLHRDAVRRLSNYKQREEQLAAKRDWEIQQNLKKISMKYDVSTTFVPCIPHLSKPYIGAKIGGRSVSDDGSGAVESLFLYDGELEEENLLVDSKSTPQIRRSQSAGTNKTNTSDKIEMKRVPNAAVESWLAAQEEAEIAQSAKPRDIQADASDEDSDLFSDDELNTIEKKGKEMENSKILDDDSDSDQSVLSDLTNADAERVKGAKYNASSISKHQERSTKSSSVTHAKRANVADIKEIALPPPKSYLPLIGNEPSPVVFQKALSPNMGIASIDNSEQTASTKRTTRKARKFKALPPIPIAPYQPIPLQH